jgi:hypothetical protein
MPVEEMQQPRVLLLHRLSRVNGPDVARIWIEL